MEQTYATADARDAARIAAAVRYKVHFRKGAFEAYREDAATLDEAHVIAARMDAEHGKNGRRAMIYAIGEDGRSTPVGGVALSART